MLDIRSSVEELTEASLMFQKMQPASLGLDFQRAYEAGSGSTAVNLAN